MEQNEPTIVEEESVELKETRRELAEWEEGAIKAREDRDREFRKGLGKVCSTGQSKREDCGATEPPKASKK